MWEKIKRFFAYVKSNKETLTSIILNLCVVAFIEYLAVTDLLAGVPFFAQHLLVCQVASGVIAFIYIIFYIHSVALSCGWEKPEEAEKRISLNALEKQNRLSKEDRKIVKDRKTELEKSLKAVVKSFNEGTKFVETYNKLSAMNGVILGEDEKAKYVEAQNKITVASNEKAKLEAEIVALDKELKK